MKKKSLKLIFIQIERFYAVNFFLNVFFFYLSEIDCNKRNFIFSGNEICIKPQETIFQF